MDTLERQIAQLRERRETVILTDAEIRRLLSFPECVDQQAVAFREFSAGRVLSPPRIRIEISHERASSVMLGYVPAVRLPEVPIAALRGNRLVVDSREAALHEAGKLVAGIAAGQLDETAIAVRS